ncbi:MAG: EthD family reductase [Pseudomonadota bacterium]
MDRRTSLSLSALACAGLVAAPPALAQASAKIKYTVLYGMPKDPAAFEKHYLEVHMPLVAAAGLSRYEASRCLPTADGAAPLFHRVFEAWFESQEQMNAQFGSAAWAKVRADVPTFATGGVTRLMSSLA